MFALLAAVAQAALLTPAATYTTGSSPRFVVTADFNNDGKTDLAVVNQSSNTVTIFLGKGDGSFAPGATLSNTGGFPAQAVAADFNGDGNVDVAVTSILGNAVSLYLGKGDGSFQPPRITAVGAAPFGIASADLNGDGKLDLVVTNGSSGSIVGQTIKVLFGNGDGTFQFPATYSVGMNPQAVAIADFNGDGKLDLAVANADSNSVSIMMGGAHGAFAPAMTFPTGYRPAWISTGDINNDGRTDLAVALGFNAVAILLGTGDGRFGTASIVTTGSTAEQILLHDLDGDGRLDLVTLNFFDGTLGVHAGKGDGTFVAPLLFGTGSRPASLAVADFNQDGKPDVALTQYTDNTASVFLNSASRYPATLTSVAGTPQSTVAGSPFTTALQALVRDAAGVPIAGTAIRFSVVPVAASAAFPGNLASSVAMSNAAGVATAASLVANTAPGSFSIVGDVAGLSTLFQLTNIAAGGQAPLFTSGPLPNGTVDIPYSSTVTASGLPSPTFTASATLPPAMTLNPATGVVSGTPTMAGSFGGTLTASNGVAPNATQAFAITIASASQTNGAMETVWVEDAVPAGAVQEGYGEGWTWTSSNPTPYSGNAASQSGTVPGMHQHYFYNATATLTVGSGDKLFAYVYLDPSSPPSEVMLQWNDGQWEHRVYWGANAIPWGVDASPARVFMGVLPSPGEWVRLEVPASVVELEGHVLNGMAFTLYDGRASWDRAGKSSPTLRTAQTISFAALPDRALGGVPSSLSAVASSGLAVSFATGTPATCAVAANSLTLLATGTCTITASQPGNGSYSAAVPVSRSFAISAAVGQSQTITFNSPADQRLGTQPFIVFAASSSGLPVLLTSADASICTVIGNTVALLAPGSCALHASQPGNGVYAAAPDVSRSFQVLAAGQAIDFAPIVGSFSLGTPAFALQATATSGLPVSLTSLTPQVCTIDGTRVGLRATGTCSIRASQQGSTRFSAADNVDRSFTVGVAAQTLTFFQPDDQFLSSPPLQLSAFASSGLPVSFASTTIDVCTVTGSIVQRNAGKSGLCTVQATQAGSGTYQAATAQRSFYESALTYSPVQASAATAPFIEYLTYLGGFGADKSFDIVVDGEGSAYVGGSVASTNFPGLDSTNVSNAGLDLLFVAKIASDGGKLDEVLAAGAHASTITGSGSSTYVGPDQVEAMAMAPNGTLYVAGYASSGDFPQTGGTYVRRGPLQIFTSSASSVMHATGAVIDPAVISIRAMAVDARGNVLITGRAGAGLATSTGAVVPSIAADAQAPYLIKIAPATGGVIFSTYLSASGSRPNRASTRFQSRVDATTSAFAMVLDGAGNVYVAGQATADDFPVTAGAADTLDLEHRDAFVAKVNATGTSLLGVARLGGEQAERATSVALSPDGSIVIGGKTSTKGFQGHGAFQIVVDVAVSYPLLDGIESGFVAKLSPDFREWIFVAAIGAGIDGNLAAGLERDPSPVKVAVDAGGSIYAAGTSGLETLPILMNVSGVDPAGAFIMKISADGRSLLYSTTLGAGTATGLAVDGLGNAYVSGYAGSGLPSASAFQASPRYGVGPSLPVSNPFVAKINDASRPLSLNVSPSPSVQGQPITVAALLAERRYSGSVEFFDGAQSLGTATVNGGAASVVTPLTAGVHRLRAAFRGSGPFNGYSFPEVIQTVNQDEVTR